MLHRSRHLAIESRQHRSLNLYRVFHCKTFFDSNFYGGFPSAAPPPPAYSRMQHTSRGIPSAILPLPDGQMEWNRIVGADRCLDYHQHSPGYHRAVAVRQENFAPRPHESPGSKTCSSRGSHREDEVGLGDRWQGNTHPFTVWGTCMIA